MQNLPPRPVLTAVSVVCRTYFSQHVSLLPRLVNRIDSFINSFSHDGALVKACARGDSAQSLQYFFSREDAICWRDAVKKAVKSGFTHVLQWMAQLPLDQGPWAADFEGTIDMAAKGGHLETVKWLHEHRGVKFSAKAMERAAKNGHLGLVQWLYANSAEDFKGDAAACAASSGHLEILKWLHSQGATCAEFGVELAAEHGHQEVIKWLSEHVSQAFNPSIMDSAAENGHLAVVKWLHGNRQDGCTTAAMDGAAANGHVAVVEWLHNNRKEGCTTSAMDGASSKGHLDVMKFLHANRSEGCTTAAMESAVRGGHVDVAQWLKDNRTEGWSEDFPDYAVERVVSDGHLEILKWLLANLPDAKYSAKLMDRAAEAGHLDMVKWLHENRTEGCSTEAMDQAAANNHLDVLKWLHSNRSEGCTANAIDYAAATGNLEIAKWLHANCHKGCTLEAFVLAAKYDNVDVLKWLYKTQPYEASRTPKFQLAMIANMSSSMRPCPRVIKWFYDCGESMPGIVENTLHSPQCINAFDAAQAKASLELVQCVVKRSPSLNTPKAVRLAAQNQKVVCMRWLLEQFDQLDADLVATLVGEYGYSEVLAVQTESNRLAAVASAARDGKLDVVKQLFMGDRERFTGTQRVIRAAVQGGHKDVVQWLRQHVDFEERYAWTSSPRVGRTRPRDDGDMPFGMQMLMGFGRRRFM